MNSYLESQRTTRFLLMLSFVLSASCNWTPTPSASTTQPAQPRLMFNWDLSKDNGIKQVGWPMTNSDDLWVPEGSGTLHVKIPDGSEHDIGFSSIQVWRDGTRLGPIQLFRNIGTVDEVYADAIKLANEWNIDDRNDIELFHKTRASRITSGGDGLYAVYNTEPPLARQIEIRQSFDSASGKPYITMMVLGCGDIYYHDTMLSTQRSRTSPDFRWDLSRDGSAKQAGWPDEVQKDKWSIDGSGVAWLKVGAGAGHDVAFRYAYLEREGDRLKSIRFELSKGQLDAVYADAMKLATDFGITDTREIQEFKNNFADRMLPTIASPDNDDKFYAAHSDAGLHPSRTVEIRRSTDPMLYVKKPYRAVLTVNFREK